MKQHIVTELDREKYVTIKEAAEILGSKKAELRKKIAFGFMNNDIVSHEGRLYLPKEEIINLKRIIDKREEQKLSKGE